MKATFISQTNISAEYSVESRSNPDSPREVHLSSYATCNCPHFVFRLGVAGAVSISDTTRHCKHIAAALHEAGIRALRVCHICHQSGAEFECCADWYGRQVIGFICEPCTYDGKISRMCSEEDLAEQEYFAQLRKADDYADYVERCALLENEDCEDELEGDDEPEYVSNDLYGGLRRERAL